MLTLDPDELVPLTFQGDIINDPPGMTARLLPFQVEGLSWMHHQETQTEINGGVSLWFLSSTWQF